MGCSVSLSKRVHDTGMSEKYGAIMDEQIVKQYDNFQLEYSIRYPNAQSSSQDSLLKSTMVSISKHTPTSPSSSSSSFHSNHSGGGGGVGGGTGSNHRSNGNSNDNDSNNNNNNNNTAYITGFSSISMRQPVEDQMQNYLSRVHKVLVQDLETLLCTSMTEIPIDEKPTAKLFPQNNSQMFDLIISLIITTTKTSGSGGSGSNDPLPPTVKRRKYITFSHRAILATRNAFFASELTQASSQSPITTTATTAAITTSTTAGVISPSQLLTKRGSISSNLTNHNNSSRMNLLRQSMPEKVTPKYMTMDSIVYLEYELPPIIQNAQSFLVLLEYIYTGLFRPEFSAKFISWVERNDLATLTEIVALAQQFSVAPLKNCAMFHMCDLVGNNWRDDMDFATFWRELCPTVPIASLKRDVKLSLDVEHVFREYRKVKRKFFYSPMQSKKQLERELEKMYIQSNTSSMTNLAQLDLTDVRLSCTVPMSSPSSAASGLWSAKQFSNRMISHKKTFRVHKSILNARSQYFRTLFQKGLVSDVIEMPSNLSFPVLKAFVHYLYTDTIREELGSLLPELLPLAMKYGVPGLKALCLKSFYDNLTEENVIEEFRIQCANLNAQLCDMCLHKISYVYPQISSQFNRVYHECSDEQRNKLRETPPLLHLRMQYQLIWNRRIYNYVTMRQLLPRHSKGSQYSLWNNTSGQAVTKKIRIAVMGTEGCGRSTLVRQIRSYFTEEYPLFPNPLFESSGDHRPSSLSCPSASSSMDEYDELSTSNDNTGGRRTMSSSRRGKKSTNCESTDSTDCCIPIELTTEVLHQSSASHELDKFDCVMLMYSLSDLHSLDQVPAMYEMVKRSSPGEKPVILIGNKVDLYPQVMIEQCDSPCVVNTLSSMQMTKQLHVPYIETNALDGINTREATVMMIKEVLILEQLRDYHASCASPKVTKTR